MVELEKAFKHHLKLKSGNASGADHNAEADFSGKAFPFAASVTAVAFSENQMKLFPV